MSELIGKSLGNYQLVEYIGRGGMSDVYRGLRRPDQFEVAVKVMRPNLDPDIDTAVYIKRFDQEAAIVAGLNHPHILPMYDYGHFNNYHYLVMKLIRGGTLAHIMRQRRLSIQEAGGWLYQISSALNHAHQRGIVHRDLKPTNILLDGQGHSYLTDFGIAKIANTTSSLTATGNVLGTPTYMAPEQWRSERLTGVTDVYGLAVLVYLMLTAKPPFESDTPHGLMYKHLNDPPPPMRVYVPEITESIDQVVLKALAKTPKDRYATTVDFSDDYQRALRGQETLAQRYPPPRVRKTTTAVSPAITAHRPAVIPVAPAPPKADPLPPPVYGDPAPVNPSAPNARISSPPVANPPQIQEYARRRDQEGGNKVARVSIWIIIILAFLSGGAYAIIADPFGLELLNFSANTYEVPTDPPLTPTPPFTPGAQPFIVDAQNIDSRDVFRTNEPITINVIAADNVEISWIELRRFGFVVLTKPNDNLSGSPTQFSTQFIYTPRTAGRHVLELMPVRKDANGDSYIYGESVLFEFVVQ